MRSKTLTVRITWCLFSMLACLANALPANVESMALSRTEMADMETSATGYSYHQQHGAPVSYVHYDDRGTGHYHNAPAPVQYIASAPVPIPGVVHEAQEVRVLELEPVSVEYAKEAPVNYEAGLPTGYIVPLLPQQKPPLAPYYVPVKVDKIPQKIEIVDDKDEGDDDDDDDDDDEDDDNESDEEDEAGHDDDDEDSSDEDNEEHDIDPENRDFDIPNKPFGHGYAEPEKKSEGSYEEGESKAHSTERHSTKGEKGDKGYKNYHGFDNGVKGKHDSENHKGHRSEDSGHKKLHSDTDGHYIGHKEGSKGESGGSYGAAASHKKGHKTKGFHNVYHKDEYKKDTAFYDDAHKSGNFEKHGEFRDHHASAEGEFKKGAHHKSGHAKTEAGKEGKFDRGHDHEESKGHKNAEGEETYHENHANYAAKNTAEKNKLHGFSREHSEPSKYTT